jgi:hypothetical protein
MIGDALRVDIERYAARMPHENPLYYRAAGGTLSAEHLARYLKSVHVLVQHTPIHLDRAIRRAEALSEPTLVAHFRHKLEEEVGHDAWAERDLRHISRAGAVGIPAAAHPGLVALLRFLERIIDADPRLYLAYILFSEYLIVLLGPEWLDLLESRCGIPKTSMTVIGNHAELDREHAAEAFESIDALVGDPKMLGPMRAVLRESMALFDAFCVSVIEDADVALRRAAAAPAA